MKYPKIAAQTAPEYLKGATSAASPYRNVSIIRKCALPIKNPFTANQPQSAKGTGCHTNGEITMLANTTPSDV